MTPEAQLIAIAKVCGWTEIRKSGKYGADTPYELASFTGLMPGFNPATDLPRNWNNSLPAYLSDLNAMHEAEKKLVPEQWSTYHGHLADASGFIYDVTMTSKESGTEWTHRICHSTAAQRAEALLRTLNLWTSD